MAVKVYGKIEILLIRAGKTESGEKNLYLGWKNEPLLSTEIQRLEKRTNIGVYPKVRRVYTSPTIRCITTSHIIYKQIPAIAITGVGPFDMGELEGKPKNLTGEEQGIIPSLELVLKNSGSYRFAALVEKTFNDIVEELEKAGIRKAAIVTHQKVIDVIISSYALPRSVHQIINVDYGGGLRLEHDLNTNSSRIIEIF